MPRTSGTFTKGDPRAKAANLMRFKHWKHRRAVKNGKHRWATMTEEEKAYVRMKRDYYNAERTKRLARLNRDLSKKTKFRVDGHMTEQELDDVENFFYGDVI